MAVSATGTLSCVFAWLMADTLDNSTPTDRDDVSYVKELASGTSADTMNIVWHDTRTVSGSSNDDLDLTNLTASYFGVSGTRSFSKVRGIYIQNNSSVSGDVLNVGAAGTNPFVEPFASVSASKVQVGADSVVVISNKKDGWTVTNASSDVLRIANPGSNAISYTICIWGQS